MAHTEISTSQNEWKKLQKEKCTKKQVLQFFSECMDEVIYC